MCTNTLFQERVNAVHQEGVKGNSGPRWKFIDDVSTDWVGGSDLNRNLISWCEIRTLHIHKKKADNRRGSPLIPLDTEDETRTDGHSVAAERYDILYYLEIFSYRSEHKK